MVQGAFSGDAAIWNKDWFKTEFFFRNRKKVIDKP